MLAIDDGWNHRRQSTDAMDSDYGFSNPAVAGTQIIQERPS